MLRTFFLGLIYSLFIASSDAAVNMRLGGDGFRTFSGDSTADPQATGVGGMLRQPLPTATGTEVLSGSSAFGVKLTDPRNETYGAAASGGPRKEYGRNGRSIVTAQSVSIVTPGANETPDSGHGGSPMSGPMTGVSNTGHSTNMLSEFNATDFRTCRWFAFQSISGQILSIRLKANWSVDGGLDPGAYNEFKLEYSLNGGGAWTNAVTRIDVISPSSGSIDVSLPVSQDISQVQVRDWLYVSTIPDLGGNISGSVSNIRLEVETDTTPPVISNVAAGGITSTGATIT